MNPVLNVAPSAAAPAKRPARKSGWIIMAPAILFVIGVLVWQGVRDGGNPDPTKQGTGSTVALFQIGVLVFREGLECVLVLSAVTASMVGANHAHRKPVFAGAGLGFLATVVTWFIAVGIIQSMSESVSALNLQAGTGLLAILVLLVIMNWFFHKVYWGGWIGMHNRKRRDLMDGAKESAITKPRLLWGLALLGFTSFYREGFEIVLFLQGYRLQLGEKAVLGGALLGAFLTGIVAVLTFMAHRHLPYRKMLILTGVLLGFVLLVMVGEEAQEMQQAHWIPTTKIEWLVPYTPEWTGLWFAIFPTVESLCAQAGAAILVIGSYFVARKVTSKPEQSMAEAAEAL